MARILSKDPKYVLTPEDFSMVAQDQPFFHLGEKLPERSSIALGWRKRHRWGFFTILMKLKSYKKIEAGELLVWQDMKWRPIG